MHVIFTLIYVNERSSNLLFQYSVTLGYDYIFYLLPLNGCYGVSLYSVTVAMAAALEATPIWMEFY